MYKEFDLERAKKGEPIICVEEEKVFPARIICTDRIQADGYNLIVLVIDDEAEQEQVYAFNENGKGLYKQDLFMAPVKRQEWVLIAKPGGKPGTGVNKEYELGQDVYLSEQAANDAINKSFPGFVKAIKIEWEE
jgi:hypothetical protein